MSSEPSPLHICNLRCPQTPSACVPLASPLCPASDQQDKLALSALELGAVLRLAPSLEFADMFSSVPASVVSQISSPSVGCQAVLSDGHLLLSSLANVLPSVQWVDQSLLTPTASLRPVMHLSPTNVRRHSSQLSSRPRMG